MPNKTHSEGALVFHAVTDWGGGTAEPVEERNGSKRSKVIGDR
jgi:hypothetical protein